MTKRHLIKVSTLLGLVASVVCGSAATLTPTKVLNPNAYTDSLRDRNITLESDNNGTVLAAWRNDSFSGQVQIARSQNSGLSWSTPQTVQGGAHDPMLIFAGGNTWILLDILGSKVSRSTDGGLTWSNKTAMSIPYSLMPFRYMYTSNKNGTVLALATSNFSDARVLRSVDGAATWTDISTLPPGVTVFSTIEHAGGTNWICQSSSNLYVSSDDGITWAPIEKPASFQGKGVPKFTTNNTNLIMAMLTEVTTTINIYASQSSDGGKTWSPATLLGSIPNSSDGGGMVSFNRVIYCGGQTWKAISLNADYDSAFIKTNSAVYMAGTTNNGLSWSAPELLVPDVGDWYGTASYADGFNNAFAGTQGNLVAAWENSNLDIKGRNIGSDGDILYRVISDAPIQTAAQDWQLFE